jgi:hypothetical protein
LVFDSSAHALAARAAHVSFIHDISRPPVPMSGAGTSMLAPM